MSKNNSFLFGANLKRAMLSLKTTAEKAALSTMIKAEQVKLVAKQSKAEFVKGYNSVK